MKQLLIVSNEKWPSSPVTDLTSLGEGQLTIMHTDGTGRVYSGKPTENFCIALGRGTKAPAFIIPEVDIKSLTVQSAKPDDGQVFKAVFTVPTPTVGTDYTVVLAKHDVVFNERNTWTATVRAKSTNAVDVATDLAKYFSRMGVAGSDSINIKASNLNDTTPTATVTIEGTVIGESWSCKLTDGLAGVSLTNASQDAKPNKLDTAYIQDLASRCAAGKGFQHTYQDGDSVLPGYPEKVEAEKYALYTLRFAVPRASAKTRDEVVNQVVHIAVPFESKFATLKGKIETLLGATQITFPSSSSD